MIQAFGAYLLWALFPLYFPLLEPAGAVEILAHRFVWTLVFMVIALSFMRAWPELKAASAKTWGTIFIAALLISVNWGGVRLPGQQWAGGGGRARLLHQPAGQRFVGDDFLP